LAQRQLDESSCTLAANRPERSNANRCCFRVGWLKDAALECRQSDVPGAGESTLDAGSARSSLGERAQNRIHTARRADGPERFQHCRLHFRVRLRVE
jgi:hypothetical protein